MASQSPTAAPRVQVPPVTAVVGRRPNAEWARTGTRTVLMAVVDDDRDDDDDGDDGDDDSDEIKWGCFGSSYAWTSGVGETGYSQQSSAGLP